MKLKSLMKWLSWFGVSKVPVTKVETPIPDTQPVQIADKSFKVLPVHYFAPFTVCIPTLNRYDLVVRLLNQFEAGVAVPSRYCIVDNGGGFKRYLLENRVVLGYWDKIDLVEPGENWGVAKSWNYFFSKYEDYILICNDDVQVKESTLEILSRRVIDNPHRVLFSAEGVNDFCFFCLRRDVAMQYMERDKYIFDENFWPAYFEDSDFQYRMKLQGQHYQVLTEIPLGVEHEVSATFKAKDAMDQRLGQRQTARMNEYYIRKWGGGPGKETYKEPFNGEGWRWKQ